MKSYFIVVWADDLNDALANHPEAVRIATDKTDDPKKACKECWGMLADIML